MAQSHLRNYDVLRAYGSIEKQAKKFMKMLSELKIDYSCMIKIDYADCVLITQKLREQKLILVILSFIAVNCLDFDLPGCLSIQHYL
jgi:hypothetical protein